MNYIYSFVIALLLVSVHTLSVAQSKAAPPTTNGLPGTGISEPSGSPGSRCGTGTVVISASAGAGGDMIKWYANQTGGTALTTGYTLVTPYLYSSTTFYMTTYNTSTGGESAPRTAIMAYIYSDPANPSVANVTRCGPGAVTFSGTAGSGGNTIEWRDAPTGGTLLAMSTSFSTPTLSSSTSYYINTYNTATGCRSARVAVTAIINTIPGTPAVNTPPAICGSGSVTLTANPGSDGNAIYWTDTSGNVLTNGVTPSINTTTFFRAYTYHTAIGLSCKSAYVSVEVIVNALPGAPSITPGNRCGPGVVTLSASAGTNESVRWYASLSGGAQLTSPGNTYAPDVSVTTTFYVTRYNNVSGCESSTRTPITATVWNNPPPPDFLGQGTTGCGAGVVRLNAFDDVGGTIKWYTSLTATTASGTGNTFDTPSISSTTNYYLSSTSSLGCESQRVTATAVITTAPQTPVFNPVATCKGSAALLTPQTLATGFAINWYTNTGSFITQSASLTTPLLSESASYSAEVVSVAVSTCKSARVNVPVTVNPLPHRPVQATETWANGSGAVTLKAAVAPGQQVSWYADAQATAYLNTGTEFTTPLLTTSTIYYAVARNPATLCVSEVSYFEATVLPLISPSLVRQEVIRISGIKEESSLSSVSDADRIVQFNYIDGLSRVHQQVIKSGSPLGKDIVQPVEYDAQGRSSKRYLPYVATTTDGSFQTTYESSQASFYSAAGDKIINDAKPYAVTVYESSPVGRLIEQGNTGTSWQPGTNHTLQTAYAFNKGATTGGLEEVRKFKSDGSSTGFYGTTQLHRIKSTDADGKVQVIYQDTRGNTLAKKQQLDQTIEGTMVNWLETYYIYDDMDRIKYILSPKGVVALKANAWTLSPAILDNYTHQFVYDTRGRLIEKKTPGQAWNYVVYDKLNRVVLTQDGLLRAANKWSFVKYDQRGRSVMQGIYLNTTQTTRGTVQIIADDLYTAANVTYPATAWYESRGTVLHGYSNTSFPKTNANGTALEVWSVNYFDNYDFDNSGTDDYNYTIQSLANENTPAAFVNGFSTGNKKLILGATPITWLYTYLFYDENGRAIQARSNNQLNSAVDNLTTFVYDFEGKIIASKTDHKGGTGKENTIVQRHGYDANGRLKNIYRPIASATPVAWTNGANILATANSIQKTAGAANWDAGAFSSNSLAAGQDGWLEFRTLEANTSKMIGLSGQDTDISYKTINYAINLSSNGSVKIYENNVLITTPLITYTAADVFSVERKNGIVKYKKNNVIIYTSVTSSAGALYADASLYTLNATLSNVSFYREAEKIVSQYEYNELGQMVDKKLHNTTGNTFLQSVDYRYTLHGRLLSINNAQLTADASNDDTDDYFGMEYLYNLTESALGNAALYNDNVSAVKWKGAGSTSGATDQKSYKYTYDKANQLIGATSQMYSGTWTKEAGAQNEGMSYDHNGNISALQRNQRKHQLSGLIASYTSESVDNLTFTYNATTGDRLDKVTDAATPLIAGGFSNGNSGTSTDYTYDGNGNVLTDLNKGISGITYNLLGKPTQINFTDGRKVDYVYDAAGNKLTMKTWQGTTLLTTTDYVNGFQYENGLLSTYAAPEGRVVMKGTNPEYQYSIADHQGNTRVVFSGAPVIAESKTTDMEGSTNADFQNYTSSRISFDLMDHTDAAGTLYTYSQKIMGAKTGLAKSMKVYPGDKVKIEGYAKYYNAQATSTNLTAFAGTLLTAFGLPVPVGGEIGTAASAVNSWGSIVAAGGGNGNNSFPKLFVNILVFDKNYNFLDIAFEQVNGGEQVGVATKAPHDYMSREYTAKEEGYVFMYFSNESPTQVEFYVDDVSTTYTPTNIVQYNEYYPFGLQTSTSWTRDNNSNNFLYNEGSELNANTGWYETMFRGYDPALGRFMQVDLLADVDHSTSPFAYAGNNPISFNDPSGLLKTTQDIFDVANDLWDQPYGGNWHDDGTENGDYDYFSSESDGAFWALNNWGYVGGGNTSANAEGQLANIAAGGGIELREAVITIDSDYGYFKGEPYYSQLWLQYRIDEKFIDYGAWRSKQTDQLQSVFENWGTVPIFGEVFDGANAVISVFRGNYGTAAVSAAAMVPILGYVKLLSKGAKALHKHHVLSQTFRPWFKSRGISNIDDYTISVSEMSHLRGIHGKGLGNLPGEWNRKWADFIDLNPKATPSEIFYQAESMLREFGLEHLPYIKYN